MCRLKGKSLVSGLHGEADRLHSAGLGIQQEDQVRLGWETAECKVTGGHLTRSIHERAEGWRVAETMLVIRHVSHLHLDVGEA